MALLGSPRPLALLALVLAAAACGGTAEPPRPQPPVPASLSELDPLLAAEIRAELDRLAGAPDEPSRWRALAELYLANGLHQESERAYAVALSSGASLPDEDRAKLWYGRAMNAIRDGRAEDGLAFGARAVELAPGYAPLSWRMGEWRFADGDLDGARESYERAIAAQPQHPGGYLGLARVHLQRDEFEPAAQILTAHVLGGPSDGYGRMLLARAYQGLGRTDEARILTAQSRGAQPQNPDPWSGEIFRREISRNALLERANQLVMAGKARNAIAILEPLLAAQPDDPTTLSNLAFALLSAGRVDEAIARARKAQELDPGGYRPVFIEALAATRRGEAGRAAALKLLRRARELQPSAADVHATLGELLAAQGDASGALESYRTGLRYAPDDLNLLLNAAALAGEAGLLEEARGDYERWIELAPLHPKRPEAVLGLADVLIRAGDLSAAEAVLRPAVDVLDQARGPLDPVVLAARRRLVEVLDGLGKVEEAAVQRKRLP